MKAYTDMLTLPRLTGYGIHHCFARSMMETTLLHNFYISYYTMAGIAVASCIALCPAVDLMGRRGGLLIFMIITALASLLQLGLLNSDNSDTLNRNFSFAFSIIGMFSSHATRYQPLPETIADGENYTRQRLLLPRKPGEQLLLLRQPESNRDYSKVQDTPLHEAANAALSTMGSTASSAIDLTAVAAGDSSIPINLKEKPDQPEPQDPSGHSSPFAPPASAMARGKDGILQANKERLLSSSPLHKAPCITDPLLADAEVLAVQESVNLQTDSIHLEINDTARSPKNEDGSGTAASHQSSPPILPQTVPASSLICTTPVIEPRPSSTLESPNPLDNDFNEIITTSELPVFEDAPGSLKDFPSPSMCDSLPPPPVPSPVPASDLDPPAQPPPSTTPDFDIPLKLETVDESACTPCIRNSQLPNLDLASSSGKDLSSHSFTPPSLVAASSRHTHTPPTDSDHIPLGDLSSVNTTTRSPAVLPVTDIVNTSTSESTTNIVQDSAISLDLDSVHSRSTMDLHPAEAAPLCLMDSTVSSPIDSGVLPIMERETTNIENNTVSSTAST
ncbi:hypothetical protein GOODEAATRI_003341 [Goodea atripinnis]|uniref:Uncharacterized protein n=1 Tax=Goodea atripinnis TaxID=208336 RepID=A0ABV0NRF4_9TELE